MEVILKFSLPDEREEWTMAMDGAKYHSIVWSYLDYLREKYRNNENEIEAEYADQFRSRLIDLLEQNGVSIL